MRGITGERYEGLMRALVVSEHVPLSGNPRPSPRPESGAALVRVSPRATTMSYPG